MNSPKNKNDSIGFFHRNHQLLTGLMIGLIVFLIPASLFAAIAENVHDGDALALDESILRFINSHSNSFLDTFLSAFTDLGGAIAIVVVTVFVSAMLLYKNQRYKALLVFASVAGASAINYVLKLLFARDRPNLWETVIHESSFSFPSGHAMASAALGLALIVTVWNTSWRILVLIVSILYILMIGYSRMYLGVHYPTDVFGGWILSGIWVAFVATSIWLFRKRRLGKVQP